ncbi:hypothetical protein ABZ942_19685 [Nocardia sp. NPDC046473]|uniref:hypothetical protein n=1 Tax=Nocardia sp. NPDC046473 TaxID=3155733 RepID=UPI0033C2DCC5
MTDNPVDDPEPVEEPQSATDSPEPEQSTDTERTPPPRVGTIPDSVVFVQPPPVT